MSLRVVIATDGSDEAVRGAAGAFRFIPEGSEVRLVTVIAARYDPAADQGGFEGPIMSEEEADAEYAHDRAAGRAAIERTEREIADRTVTEVILSAEGSVVDALSRYATAEGIDLIVVGASGAGWFQRLLYGSTDEQLVRHAPVPVLVMNQPE